MHYVLWFIYLVNGELYSAPIGDYHVYDDCQTAKVAARAEMERDYPGDVMFFACVDRSEV